MNEPVIGKEVYYYDFDGNKVHRKILAIDNADDTNFIYMISDDAKDNVNYSEDHQFYFSDILPEEDVYLAE